MMEEMEFHTPCERMRFEAMRDGTGSPADLKWRQHAAHCPDCQDALHILDFLQKQDSEEKLTIPAVDATKLVEAARKQYSPEQRRHTRHLFFRNMVSWCACAVSVAILFSLCVPVNWLRERVWEMVGEASQGSLTSVEALEPTANASFIPLPNSDADETMEHVLTPAEAAVQPDVLPGRSLDRAIRTSRERVQSLMRSLEDQIDRDFTEY